MRLQKQTINHDPTNGKWGNCHPAVYASLLGIDIKDVPHFFDGGRSGREANLVIDEFHAKHGIIALKFCYECGLAELLHSAEANNPGVPYILGGESATGVNHSVIACGGKIIHDPSNKNAGIVGPCIPDRRHFEITYLVRPPALAAAPEVQALVAAAVRAERERWAQWHEAKAVECKAAAKAYRDDGLYDGSDGLYDGSIEAFLSDALLHHDCAAAIRADAAKEVG